ncbi:lactoylglutathione lyase [Nocardioides massiliensis]|uniref:Lactoylglutathione lyase n=1 Tax=Nocardioides massiliensis TaxID=1325935 RepID=A0ABT9NLW9_9ACTN|nr:lactoylglutathione lyase [Nocardioides massiliensis]MDP9820820.1 hypothetical protein [Nocardioides massiliensis]
MYDLLIAADMMVEDPDRHADLLVNKLGVHSHPRWRQAPETMNSSDNRTHNYIAHFLRVNKSLAEAPTRLEPQHHWEVPAAVDPLFGEHLRSLAEFQGVHRPMKTHSLTIAHNAMEVLLERLASRGLPFRVAPVDDVLPFERVWVGLTPTEPRYRPVVDGGLMFEFHAADPLQLPASIWDSPAPAPAAPEEGAMIRIQARTFLVHDLDTVLRQLSENLDWEPMGPTEIFEKEGFRRAQLGFRVEHSATIDLIQPLRWNCAVGKYIHTWGPGPYATRILVNGLDATSANLSERGTRHEIVDDESAHGGSKIVVDPNELDGTLIEFVDWTC